MYYVLDGKVPRATSDAQEYYEFNEKFSKRIVKQTKFPDGSTVSTVFLTCAHGYRNNMPILFETIIFGGEHDEYQERYCTWDEAEAGHETTVQMIINARLIENNKTMENEQQEMEFKKSKSNIAAIIEYLLPLIEELNNEEMLPFALIGVSKNPKEDGKTFQIYVATHNETQDKMFYEMCKSYITAIKNGTAIKK